MNPCSQIVFDWNGTLLNDIDHAVDCVNSVLAAYHMEKLDKQAYRSKFCFPVRKFYERLGFDFEKTPFQPVVERYSHCFNEGLDKCPLQDGAGKVLRSLHAGGIPMSILSAMHRNDLAASIAHHNIGGLFANIEGLDDRHAEGKFEIARRLQARLGCPPSEVVYVGDTQHDVEVGEKIGWRLFLVSNGHQDWSGGAKNGAILVSGLSEFRAAL